MRMSGSIAESVPSSVVTGIHKSVDVRVVVVKAGVYLKCQF